MPVNHVASKARKKILKLTRGYFGARKNVWTPPYLGENTFREHKNKKRNFRALWIQRINAAAGLEGMSYSNAGALHKAGIDKVLADFSDEPSGSFQGYRC